jgi:hypothetical protein
MPWFQRFIFTVYRIRNGNIEYENNSLPLVASSAQSPCYLAIRAKGSGHYLWDGIGGR